MNWLIGIDRAVTLWINGLLGPQWDSLWLLLSDAKVWFPAYAIVMVVMLWKLGWKKGLIVIASLILTVVLTDQLSADIKQGFERLRPCYTTWMLENGLRWPVTQPHHFGFFSGHASNTFGFAIASYMGFKGARNFNIKAYGTGVFIWAVMVALSRVMLAAHYFGDVLVGTVFGLAVGAVVAYAARLIIRKVRFFA